MERTVLLTGCSSGIGRESALRFLDQGWVTYATARSLKDIEELGEMGCHTAELDVTQPEQISTVVQRIIEENGHIDCLVNNAGSARIGALEEFPADSLQYEFDVNLFGPHRLVRSVLPSMREKGNGTIINVSSGLSHVSLPAAGPYSATKHAMKSYTETLRMEVEPLGIDVVHIEPGFTKTGFEEKIEAALSDSIGDESPYRPVHENAIDINKFMMRDYIADDPSKVAEAIVQSAEADDPSLRKPVGWNVRLTLAERWLPKRLRLWAKRTLFWR